MISIKTTKNLKRIKQFLKIVTLHKLRFQYGGISLIDENDVMIAGLLYYKNQPICFAVITNNNIMFGANIACYTNPQFRKKGLAKLLIRKMLLRIDSSVILTCSELDFYKKVVTKNFTLKERWN